MHCCHLFMFYEGFAYSKGSLGQQSIVILNVTQYVAVRWKLFRFGTIKHLQCGEGPIMLFLFRSVSFVLIALFCWLWGPIQDHKLLDQYRIWVGSICCSLHFQQSELFYRL